jgi:hypothetical protein
MQTRGNKRTAHDYETRLVVGDIAIVQATVQIDAIV